MDSNSTDSFDKSESQPDHNECIKLLQLVLDDEATANERNIFEKHVCNCMPYFEIYEVDKAIKTLVKKNCCGKEIPEDLTAAIKAKVFQKAD